MAVAACASMRANLNRVQKAMDALTEPDMNSVRKLAMLTTQWRGLMRAWSYAPAIPNAAPNEPDNAAHRRPDRALPQAG